MNNPPESPEVKEPLSPEARRKAERDRQLLIGLTAILVTVPLVLGALRLLGWI